MTILRYPGGKSRGVLHNAIVEHIKKRFTGGRFGEMFFGGGGVTLKLIKEGVVDDVIIAEKDKSLWRLWWNIIHEPDDLICRIEHFTPSVSAFLESKQYVLEGCGTAFDALVVNRLSHAGRGVRAGPQGGHYQNGKYKIDCRWNTPKLIDNVKRLHELFGQVKVEMYLDYRDAPLADYMYVDPPYYEVGNELYLHSFTEQDHIDLCDWLHEHPEWLLSYNNHKEVISLYEEFNVVMMSTSGNGGEKKNSELLIFP